MFYPKRPTNEEHSDLQGKPNICNTTEEEESEKPGFVEHEW